jgi:hypothetical protein
VHLDALRVRLVDERLQRVERGWRDPRLLGARDRCAIAEAVAAAHGLYDDRVEPRRLGRCDDRIDPRRVEEVVTEGVDPVRAELTPRRRRRIEVRRVHALGERHKRQYGHECQGNLPHYLRNDEATAGVAGG